MSADIVDVYSCINLTSVSESSLALITLKDFTAEARRRREKHIFVNGAAGTINRAGSTPDAKPAAARRSYNFPGSEWYQDSYALLDENYLKPEANEDSWIVKAWKSVF